MGTDRCNWLFCHGESIADQPLCKGHAEKFLKTVQQAKDGTYPLSISSKSTCATKDCDAEPIVTTGAALCASHKCKVDFCPRLRKKKEEDDGYCDRHLKCPVARCSRFQEIRDTGGGDDDGITALKYCVEHAVCREDGCKTHVSVKSPFCLEHRCAVDECTEGRDTWDDMKNKYCQARK